MASSLYWFIMTCFMGPSLIIVALASLSVFMDQPLPAFLLLVALAAIIFLS